MEVFQDRLSSSHVQISNSVKDNLETLSDKNARKIISRRYKPQAAKEPNVILFHFKLLNLLIINSLSHLFIPIVANIIFHCIARDELLLKELLHLICRC